MSYNEINCENGLFVYANDNLIGRFKGPVSIHEHSKYDLIDTLAGCTYVMNDGEVVFTVCNGYGRNTEIGKDERGNHEMRIYATI